MTVVRHGNGWAVQSGCQIVQDGFATSAAAWRWLDRREGDPISPAEKKSAWVADKILDGGAA